jgi:hypothetical protein
LSPQANGHAPNVTHANGHAPNVTHANGHAPNVTHANGHEAASVESETAPPATGPIKRSPVVIPSRDFAALAAAVLERAPLLHCIAIGRALSWDDQRLVIGFESQFSADQVRDKLPQLHRILAEDLGLPFRVEVQVAAAPPQSEQARAAESLVDAEARKKSDDRARRRREAIEHPARKLITEVFGDDVTFQEPELE